MLIEAPELSSFPRIRHAFFTRQGGVSQGIYASLNGGVGSADQPEAVAENRARMAGEFGLDPGALLTLFQIHSAEVVTVERPWPAGERPKADAMVTRVPHLAIGVASADCGPVLFADPHAGIIGAAHAGWKGAVGGVLEATVARMEELGAKRSDIVAVLGPTIGPTAYEVGPEFVHRLLERSQDSRRFFTPSERPDHALFDLPAYILDRLLQAGIGEAEWLGLCTYSDPERFFSYRRSVHTGEADYGRLISAISLTQ